MRLSMSSPRYPRWGKGWGQGEDLTTSTCPGGWGIRLIANCTCTPVWNKHASVAKRRRRVTLLNTYSWRYANTPLAQSPQHAFGRDCHHGDSIELFEEPCPLAAPELASTFEKPPLKRSPFPSTQCVRRIHV